jgi:hypothetical protein
MHPRRLRLARSGQEYGIPITQGEDSGGGGIAPQRGGIGTGALASILLIFRHVQLQG